MVGGAVAHPAATTEPRVMVSRSRGSSVTRASVTGTPLRVIAHPRSLASAQSELDLRPVFTTLIRSACLRLRLILPLCLLVSRPHVSLSQALPWAFASWGIPPVRASGLAACSDDATSSRRAFDGLLRPMCPFSVTLGRHCTPRPSYRVNTTYPAILRGRMETFPFLGLRPVCPQTGISHFAGSNSRRLHAFVENPDHSHPFEVSPQSAKQLIPFLSLHSDA
jgi:hypothetical protein